MSEFEQKVRRNLRMYAQGVVTRVELVNSFLFGAASCNDCDELLRMYHELPDDAREGLLNLLTEIQGRGGEWHPLILDRSAAWDESQFQADVRRVVRFLLQTAE